MGTRAYLIGQGYSNLKKHGGKTFSTMLIICATMLILGLFIILYVNIDTNVKVVTENQGLKAFIAEEIDEDEVAGIAEKIKQITNVKSITYLDKEAALEDAKDTLKEYAYLLDGYESFNPFPRSFIVVFENLESTEHVKEAIESVDGISSSGYGTGSYSFCAEDGCFNYGYGDEYCSTHEPVTYYPYCKYSTCLNRAYAGDYCIDHNYLE